LRAFVDKGIATDGSFDGGEEAQDLSRGFKALGGKK
jgi:hypothetical protein